jgi:endonuclease/exonuclease/phosphatase family metal-dependent hydrolase
VPDDPGPRTRAHSRAWWAAPAGVVGVLALAVLAMRLPEEPAGSSPTTASWVVTASASAAASPPGEPGATPNPGPGLRPVVSGRDRGCREPVLRVLQFNIHFGVSRAGDIDPNRIAAEIRARRPDLVSLNEVDSRTLRTGRVDEAGYLARATGLRAIYGPNLLWDGGLFGNAILTRFPVVESQNLALPGVAGLEPRGLLTATVRVGGRDVTFSSTHLSDGSDGRVSRTWEAEAIANVLRHATGPTIVAGDLNSRPHDVPVRILRQYLLDSQHLGGVGRGDTVPETDPEGRIDYVLYDSHLAVVPGSTRVLPSASSDHRAVFTKLALLPDHSC